MKGPSEFTLKPCTPDDYEELLEVLDIAFQKPDKHWFVKNLEHIFPKPGDTEREGLLSNHLICRDHGAIAGAIGIYPLSFQVGNHQYSARLSVGGIGSVSTLPEFRNRGIMSFMLQETSRRMEEAKYDVAWLVGERQRYNNYGYEIGGRRLTFNVLRKAVERACCESMDVNVQVPGQKKIELLDSLYSRHTNRALRDWEAWSVHLKRPNLLWKLAESSKGAAYIVCSMEHKDRIMEIQGDLEVACSLLMSHMKEYGLYYSSIHAPYENNRMTGFLYKLANSILMTNPGMIKVVHVESLWEKLSPMILGNRESVSLRFEEKKVLLEKALGFEKQMELFGTEAGVNGLPVQPVHWWLSEVDEV